MPSRRAHGQISSSSASSAFIASLSTTAPAVIWNVRSGVMPGSSWRADAGIRASTGIHASSAACGSIQRGLPDQPARDYAVDPRHNVVLEASAGTGKTSVLVRRYLALLDVGVDPANILAITFTRKAAAEMRERIIGELKRRAAQ